MQPNRHSPIALADRKSLVNPWADKPVRDRDAAIARSLQVILDQLPERLAPAHGHRHPLLAALATNGATVFERRRSRLTADTLQSVAALIHDDADERRVAEYLLRHREEVRNGRRSVAQLIRAARCAAEMDRRHASSREVPVGLSTRAAADGPPDERTDCDSVADTVVAYSRAALGNFPDAVANWIADGTVCAMALAERHRDKGGQLCAVIAMRPSARRDARLVTAVREFVPDDRVARDVSRLLLGPDDSPEDTALLWGVARGPGSLEDVPPLVRARWAVEISRLSRSARRLGLATGVRRRWLA